MEEEDMIVAADEDEALANAFESNFAAAADANNFSTETTTPNEEVGASLYEFGVDNLPSLNGGGDVENLQPSIETPLDPTPNNLNATNDNGGAPSENTNVNNFKYRHSADGYHYYEDDGGSWYAQDDAGYWYYQETDGNFKLWDSQNSNTNAGEPYDAKKSSDIPDDLIDAIPSAVDILFPAEKPSVDGQKGMSESVEEENPNIIISTNPEPEHHPIVPVDTDGRPQYPRGSDGKFILPVGPDGKKVFPLGRDNKPLFPIDDNGNPVFPVGDDGQPVFPIGPNNKPIVPVDRNGNPVFPLDATGMPIFPLGPDGKPTAPITVTDSRLVLPMDQNGKPIVPYGPDGQPLIHVGADNLPIEAPPVPNSAPPGADWNQYWSQYYQYWNYYNYNNQYGGYPQNPPMPGYGQTYANHSYVGFGSAGFGSGVKKPKVRPEDIDLPAGPAPPKKYGEDNKSHTSFDAAVVDGRKMNEDVLSPNNGRNNPPAPSSALDFGQKESATKSLITKQIKALAALQKYKKENENESRSSSTGPSAAGGGVVASKSDDRCDDKVVKSASDMYGPRMPPMSNVVPMPPVQKTSAPSEQPLKPNRNRWEPPPPGTQETMMKISPPKLITAPVKAGGAEPPERGRHRSESKERSRSESKSRSRSPRRKRSRSRSYNRSPRSYSRSRSRSPYRGDRNYGMRYGRRGRFRDDWRRGGWRPYSRYGPRGPPSRSYRPGDHWHRTPSHERRRQRSERKTKSKSKSRSPTRSSSASDKSERSQKGSVSRSPSKEKQTMTEASKKKGEKNSDVVFEQTPDSSTKGRKPLVDYQPDEPIEDDQPTTKEIINIAPSFVDEVKIKIISKDENEIDWPKRIVLETRTVPLLQYSCKPDTFDTFVNLKKSYDENQKTQPAKVKQEQDAMLQPHKPISFGLVKLDATHVQRTVAEPAAIDQSSKWKPLAVEDQSKPAQPEVIPPPIVLVEKEIDDLTSNKWEKSKKKGKKGEPKVDPELENLRHAALLSMEKAQKDLAYYESVVKQTETIVVDKENEPSDDAKEKRLSRKRKISGGKKQKKRSKKESDDDDEEESEDVSGSSDDEEHTRRKKRTSISKRSGKRHSKKLKKAKVHRKRSKRESTDDDDDEEESEYKNDSDESSGSDAVSRSEKRRSKKKHRSRKMSTDSNASDAKRKQKSSKKKGRKKSKKRKQESSSDDDENESGNLTKRSDDEKYGPSKEKSNPPLPPSSMFVEDVASDDDGIYIERRADDDDALSEDDETKLDEKKSKKKRKQKAKKKKKHASPERGKKKHKRRRSRSSSSSDDHQRPDVDGSSKQKDKRQRSDSQRESGRLSDVETPKGTRGGGINSTKRSAGDVYPAEIVSSASAAESAKESVAAATQSWMPKIHEIFLPSDNYSLKSKEFYEIMMKGSGADEPVPPPPPPPPKEKKKKSSGSSLYAAADSPPPPPPPPPKKDSKAAILSPSKLTPHLQQQPIFVPVATYRPMAGVQQYGAPPPPPNVSSGYSNVKYSGR